MSNIDTTAYAFFYTLDHTGAPTASSYALPFTPLTFVPQLSDINRKYSNTKILWDFGDGTTSEAVTGVHFFKEIGDYNVSCFLYDVDGNSYRNTYSQNVRIVNYITDSLSISCSNLSSYTLTAGRIANPFIISNQLSWQSIKGNPKGNFSILTYLSGVNTNDYFRDNIIAEPYSHLYPYASVYLLLTGVANTTEFVEVSSFTTITEPIYITLSSNKIVRVDENYKSAFFAGVTGTRDVYYKSDVDKLVSFLMFGYNPNEIRPYANTSSVGLKVRVIDNNNYSKLSISSNGLDAEGSATPLFNIDKNKFNNTKISFVIKIKDSQNFTIKNTPPLTSINIVLTDGAKIYDNVAFTRLSSLSSVSNAFYKGFFTTNLSANTNNLFLSANCRINSQSLTGISSTFNISLSSGKYNLIKKGEEIDFESKFKHIAFQPLFLDKKILFTDFLGTIFGSASSSPLDLGKVAYEKIQNFVDNNSVLDYCNISRLQSILESYNIDPQSFASNQFNYPPSISRLANLLSINYSKLRGAQNTFNENFHTLGYINNSEFAKNLGNEISLNYTITAGTDIVAFEKYSGKYTLLNTYAPLCATNISLTGNRYTLKEYNTSWGWNLLLPVNGYGENIKGFYLFYEYIPGIEGTVYDSIIDYENNNNTLSFNQSSYSDWSAEGGIMSNVITQDLYNNLNLFL